MKINRKVLSIPPHISTSWNNVSSLHAADSPQGKILIVTLINGSTIEIPSLSEDTLNEIFSAHSGHIEGSGESLANGISEPAAKQKKSSQQTNPFAFGGENTLTFGFPLKFGDLDSIGNFGGMMQHNMDQANAPDMPREILDKITSIAKAVGLDKQFDQLPKAEPHCNCPFCQISKAFHGENQGTEKTSASTSSEEEVSDEELTFREWDIKEMSSTLFEVTNPLDKLEHYQVFLGEPVGCTCGKKNCEHIKAVLKS